MNDVESTYISQKAFFHSGKTADMSTRRNSLLLMKELVLNNVSRFLKALNQDLSKCEFESVVHEISGVVDEINFCLKRLKSFVDGKTVRGSIASFPSRSKIVPRPRGMVLSISPWDYPFLLTMRPIVSAIAAGNTVIFKPSELTPNVSGLIVELINRSFSPNLIRGFAGGVETSQRLLNLKFDHVFFTGSTRVGKIIYSKAAQHLSTVTLELGGKCPVLLDDAVDIDQVAKKIAWAKCINAGQTCVAPDYVILPRVLRQRFYGAYMRWVRTFFGQNPIEHKDYSSIISTEHTRRLIKLMAGQTVVFGGQSMGKRINPTIIDEPEMTSGIMREEIFGPLLPVLGYDNVEGALEILKENPEPLAMYLFSNKRAWIDQMKERCICGAVLVNDLVIHLAQISLPFGGVGASGIGRYHGEFGLETFSHMRPEMTRPSSNLLDIPLRYPPYTKLKLKIIKNLFGIYGSGRFLSAKKQRNQALTFPK